MNKEHLHPEGRPYTKEEFIEKIKSDKVFAKRFANLGPVYGKQWRSWRKPATVIGESNHSWQVYQPIDQIQNLINELKTNPDSRRMLVNSWNVGELSSMVLPPCHYSFQVYTRELSFNKRYRLGNYQPYDISGKVEYENGLDYITEEQFTNYHNLEMDKLNIPRRAISIMFNQRSVDTFLGLPFNIASYGLLLEIIAKEVNMIPDELIGNLGDCHLYLNHIEQAKEQITRTPYELPTLKFPHKLCSSYGSIKPLQSWECYVLEDFELENYQSHPSIKAPLSN